MLIDLFPRAHARYASLPLLGPQMDGFAHWLADKGLSTLSIRNRILRAPRLEEILSDRSIHCLGELSQTELLEFGAVPAADDSRQSALVQGHFFVRVRGSARQ